MSFRKQLKTLRKSTLRALAAARRETLRRGALAKGDAYELVTDPGAAWPGYAALPAVADDAAGHSISCVMVSRGFPDIIGGALASFAAQDHARRELVVVVPEPQIDAVRRSAAAQAVEARIIAAPDGATLGELRNFAIARSDGEIVCQWDDDDIYAHDRLRLTAAALVRSQKAAAMLNRVTFWWPARRTIAISRPRHWEGTITAWRKAIPIYPALARGEDTFVTHGILRYGGIAKLDAPELYVYRVTGRNTWDAPHFEKILKACTGLSTGVEHDRRVERLAGRVGHHLRTHGSPAA
ncbi:glycosyltransferase [Prosthecodimorpha staleyi]|uniref:Glycosyltransferase family 2 protein n=1 Tax=Prosthecodimorpha staleyi TaxID=2840188 RepID=A0A947D718_9HYPH|nr:glycosyltransferase family A protein [Prosthecodimorpha staleyi]MBT9288029.1 glycosyltransferase family 2 protein [Prosthecodimorpha staleyi]